MRKHFSTSTKTARSLIQETAQAMHDARLWMVASSLAYTTLLSIVPLLAVSFAIFQIFGGMFKLQGAIQPFIAESFSEDMAIQISSAIGEFAGRINASTLGFSGLLALIVTSMSLLSNADRAIHHVWNTPIRRSGFQRFATYWLFVTFGPIAMAVALGAATGLELKWIHVLPSGISGFLFTMGLFFCTHRWIPDCKVDAAPAWIAAAYTALAFMAVRLGFATYTRYAVSANKIYGSLGAIPVFMFWVYLQWLVFFSGVALTRVLQTRFQKRA